MRFDDGQDMSASRGSPDTGSLLIAHPLMEDPNFRRTLVFLTVHNAEQGAVGVVMNRAMHKNLGELYPELSNSSLSEVPIFEGGPVAPNDLILAAWKWMPDQSAFQLYFGIDNEKAEALLADDSGFQVSAFMGHAGWTKGQLNAEIEEGAWLLSRGLPEFSEEKGESTWRRMLLQENPALCLLADVPDDPSLN